MCPTFLGVSQQKVRLGDIKLSNFSSGTSALQLLNAYGATAKVSAELIGSEAFAEFGAVDAVFICATEEDAEEYGCTPGWYLPDDWDNDGAFPMNDVLLKKGQGFIIQVNDAELKITYSGEVDSGEEGEISLPYNIGEKNVMGNCTPVDLVLGDVALANFSSGTSALQFLNAYGATAKVTATMIGDAAFSEFGAVDAVFICATQEDAGEYGCVPGWYLPDDWDNEGAYPMNNVKLPAGKAFVLQVNDAGLVVTLPSALASKAK